MSGPETAGSSNTDDLLLAQLTEEERAKAAVYLNDDLLPPGESVVGGVEIRSDGPYRIAFIDQRPGANWMHGCRYLVIAADGEVTSIKSDRPPVFGILPRGWRLVWSAEGVEEWMLLPGAAAKK